MKVFERVEKMLLLMVLVLLASTSMAQQAAYESPAGTKFLLYTPPGYHSSTGTFPLLLSLHGRGEVGDDLTELTSKGTEQLPSRLIYLNRWPQDLPFIVLTPQLKAAEGDPDPQWGPQWPAEYMDEVVRYVTANFRVDLQRIYVTGISKGAFGTWTYASAYPEKVAAIIPISGRSDLTKACAIKNIPLWTFHGDGDGLVGPEYSVDMVNAIKACQPRGTFTPNLNILHARDHNGWNEVYNGTSGYKIYEWLLMFRKNDASNRKPYVNAGPDLRIALRNSPLHIAGDFFDSDGSIANVTWRQTAGTALSISGTASEFLKVNALKTGFFEFELMVTDDKGLQNSDRVSLEITHDAASPAITDLILIDGKTNMELGSLSEGQVIDKTGLGLTEINIKAVTTSGTGSVRFSVNTDQNVRTQNIAPFLIKNQTNSPEWQAGEGVYVICATPYAKTYTVGDPGVSQCYKVVITEGVVSQPCSGIGKIQQEVWTGISGTSISSIPLASEPSFKHDLTLFEGKSNLADNYGSRIRGFICPPATGNYVFWISGNDRTELWLSTDANPANKKKIASTDGYTGVKQWDKFTTQQSTPIALVANQKYYIEALHKELEGLDHVAVGWQLPGGTLERPIPGMRLIPFGGSSGGMQPVVSITSPNDGQIFSAPASVSIAANASISEGSIAKVEFYNGSAKLAEDATAPYTYTWTNVQAGNYTVVAKALSADASSATASVEITVTGSSSACGGTGTILRELWTNVPNADVASIPVDSPPDDVMELTIFEDLSDFADSYGTRLSGYICPPVTGAYTFWISGNDHAELSLSTDDDPANKTRIAYFYGYTNPREWTKFARQQSAPINLLAGQRYYIEALHKENGGVDHMAVGWRLPNGTLERPIPGNRLSPFSSQSVTAEFQTSKLMAISAQDAAIEPVTVEAMTSGVEVYPNPLNSKDSDLTILVNGANESTIEITNFTGQVLLRKKIFCEANCNPYVFQVRNELPPGVFHVKVISNGQMFTKRLLVK